jgi:Cache domain
MTSEPTSKGLPNAEGARQLGVTASAAFGLAFLAIAGLVAAGVWVGHSEAMRDGRHDAEDLAAILSEDLAIRINSIQEALLEIAGFSRFIGGPNTSGQEWMTLLRTVAAGRFGFEALMVTDSNGRVTFSSLPLLMGESRAAGKAFAALSENPRSDALIADDPERSSNDSKLVVPLARVIRSPNAEFEGLAIANLAPDQLRELYKAADVGEHGTVWLLKSPDTVLVREPSSDTPNDEPWPSVLAGEIGAGRAGVAAGPITNGGRQYVTAYRSLGDTGLILAVSLAKEDIVAPWWRETYVAVAFTVLAGLILLVAAFWLTRTTRDGTTTS